MRYRKKHTLTPEDELEKKQPDSIPKNQLVLYADNGYDSHVVRFLLAEKNIAYHHSFLASERPEDLTQLNPYRTLPILVHGDTVLYELNTIFEYLEERYRHQKLLPEAPQQRAQVRQLAWRIQKDWLSLGRELLVHPDSFNKTSAEQAKKQLVDSLVTLSPLFSHKSYFLSDTLNWCDILLAPLLWHLQNINLTLPQHLVRPLIEYQQRMFERESFKQSIKSK